MGALSAQIGGAGFFKGMAFARKLGTASPAMMTKTLGSASSGDNDGFSSGPPPLWGVATEEDLRLQHTRMISATAMRPIATASPPKR